MEKSKKTMLCAALAVAVVAFAGAGYAAVTYYTATTSTTGDLDATYVKLSQSGGSAYADILATLYFDTTNDSDGVFDYDPVATHVSDSSNTSFAVVSGHMNVSDTTSTEKYYALISKESPLTLVVDTTHSTGATYSLVASSSNFTAPTNLTYTMVLGHFDTTVSTTIVKDAIALGTIVSGDTSTATWDFGTVTIPDSGSWSLFLFVSGTVDDFTGSIASVANIPFAFTLTATPSS